MAAEAEPSTAGERRARWAALAITLPYLSLGIVDAFYVGWLSHPVWLYWAADAFEHIVLGGLLLWAILRATGWRLADLGLAWPPGARPGLRLLVYALIAAPLLASSLTDRLTLALGVPFPVGESEYDYDAVMPGGGGLRVLAVLYLCASSSIVEEIFYRGVLWRAIAPAGSGLSRQIFFVVFSALLFGASHTEQGAFGVVTTGIWGALCSVMLLGMRSLWPLIIGHAATNLFQFRVDLLG